MRSFVTALTALLVAAATVIGVPNWAGATDAPTPDLAGTIVYIHANNVWIARPNGSGARAVTRDGTTAAPYRYPSQDDHGHIAVSHGQNTLTLMDQRGTVLRSWHATNDYPSISPDGRTIAFSYLTRVGVEDPTYDHVLRYIDATRSGGSGTDVGHSFQGDTFYASWVGSHRTVLTGVSTPTQVRYQALAAANSALWFSDCDSATRPCSSAPATDSDNWMSTVDRSGTRFSSIVTLGGPATGDTEPTFLTFQSTSNAVLGTPPAEPQLACSLPLADTVAFPGFAQISAQTPSWSPSGRSLALSIRNAAGVWQVWRIDTGTDLNACGNYGGAAILANATTPRWSPAPLSPARLRTHVALASSKYRARRRTLIRLRAVVSSGTGRVRFLDGSRVVRSVLVKRRVATFATRGLKVGRHRIKAVYGGDRTHVGSTSRVVTIRIHR